MTTTFTANIRWDAAWVDETAYLRRITIRSGFDRARDSVAGVGACELVLENSSGRFSPGNTGGALYGHLLPRKEVRVQASDGANTWTIFRGWIDALKPAAGEYGDLTCTLECVDGLAMLAQQSVSVAHEDTKAVDEAVAAVVSAAYTPLATSYSDNGDELEHYGQAWKPEHTTARDALKQICDAVWGRFFITRSGTATYWSREDRQDPSGSAQLTLSDHAVNQMLMDLDVNGVINKCQVVVYPAETVGSVQEIWRARTALRIAPGQSREVHALFRDDNGERCAAVDVVEPVANTDYTVNEASDGSGVDYTTEPSFSISFDTQATRMKITLGNTATGPLYVTLLKVRGKPIRIYDPITFEDEDATSQAAYEVRATTLDLQMQGDPVFGEALAGYLVHRYKDPALVVDQVTVNDRDTINSTNVYSLELLDKVLISDSQSGAASLLHWIRGVEYDLGTGWKRVSLHLERADDTQYWLLGTTNYGELGTNTRLGL